MESPHFQLPEETFFSENSAERKYSEYEKQFGRMCLLHEVSSSEHIPEIFKSGFLMSTLERERLGLKIEGKSSEKDKRTGGASNVFTRLAVERPHDEQYRALKSGVYFVLDSALLDRKDWYGYPEDSYGRAAETRISHSVFIKTLAQHKRHHEENEVMFPDKVDLSHLDSIVVSYEKFVLFLEQWIESLSCSFIVKMQLILHILKEKPDDNESLKCLFEKFNVSPEDQEYFFAQSPLNIVSNLVKKEKTVQYARTWQDCVELSHHKEPQLHPKINSFFLIFSEISNVIAKRDVPYDIPLKKYKTIINLLFRAAEGTFSEKPEQLLEKIKFLLV